MVPASSAQLETRGEGLSARIERLHVNYASRNPAHRVDVRIQNDRPHVVRVAPEKVELARRNQSVTTASSGVRATVIEGNTNLGPGESGTYRIVLPRMRIDGGEPYALLIDGALGLSRGTLAPLPLVRPSEPHLGYLAPEDASWVIAGRLGGGAMVRAPYLGGLGGFEIFVGRQIGRLAFGAFGTLGAGAWGGEMRLRFDPAKVLSIMPFFGYGYYPLVGVLGFNVGHGARWGFELQFSTGDTTRFGYPRNSTKVGLYALGGPVFLNAIDGVATMGQIGLSFGIF